LANTTGCGPQQTARPKISNDSSDNSSVRMTPRDSEDNYIDWFRVPGCARGVRVAVYDTPSAITKYPSMILMMIMMTRMHDSKYLSMILEPRRDTIRWVMILLHLHAQAPLADAFLYSYRAHGGRFCTCTAGQVQEKISSGRGHVCEELQRSLQPAPAPLHASGFLSRSVFSRACGRYSPSRSVYSKM